MSLLHAMADVVLDNLSRDPRRVVLGEDTIRPCLAIEIPADGSFTSLEAIDVSGTVEDPTASAAPGLRIPFLPPG